MCDNQRLEYSLEDCQDKLAETKAKLATLRKDFEIVRTASRLFEQAANSWMDRALKAEGILEGNMK